MSDDANTIAELERACNLMSLAQLRRFCEGSLRASFIAQRVLVEKWPEEWQKLNDDIEAGRLTL